MKISLCMIVKNEADVIERCIESVKGKVDEVIVVDTGSDDRTKEIVKSLGGIIIEEKWEGDFSKARNTSLVNAKGDYILVLDADEYLDENVDLKKVITSLKDYYMVNIKNYLDSDQVAYHSSIRLFKKSEEIIYRGKIHENIEIKMGMTGEKTDILIHHEGYISKIYKKKNKSKRNMELLVDAVKTEPNGFNFMNLGIQYELEEEYEKALDAFLQSYKHSTVSNYYLPILLKHMIKTLYSLKRYREAIDLSLGAISSYPNYTDIYYYSGNAYQQLGYYEDAKNMFMECINIGEISEYETLNGVGSFLSHAKIADLFIQENNIKEGIKKAHQSLMDKNDFLPAINLIIQCLNLLNLSVNSYYHELFKLIPMKNQVDIHNVLKVLYHNKSKVLHEVIKNFNIEVDQFANATAILYAGEYIKAFEMWNKLDLKNENDTLDLILLSIIMKDTILLKKIKNESYQLEIIELLVSNRNIELAVPINRNTFEILLKVCRKLIELNEFETFEQVFEFLNMWSKVEQKKELINVLLDYGFSELCISICEKVAESDRYQYLNSELARAFEMIGDYDSSKQYLLNEIKRNPNYRDHIKLIHLCKVTNQIPIMNDLIVEFKELYPESNVFA